MSCLTIAEIVLQYDQRGIAALRPYLPADSYQQAARLLLQSQGPIILATGFYVNGHAETDGPAGTLALAQALHELGREVYVVTDRYGVALLSPLLPPYIRLKDFPIVPPAASQAYARQLLQVVRPACLVAIERCGLTRQQRYLNMRGQDITAFTAQLDYLFDQVEDTIGIGDGGNEIGMGQIYEQVQQYGVCATPAVTATKHLLLAAVSNWGAYGLITALAQLTGQKLLPDSQLLWQTVKLMVAHGAVDGYSGQPECRVDGFGFREHHQILQALQAQR